MIDLPWALIAFVVGAMAAGLVVALWGWRLSRQLALDTGRALRQTRQELLALQGHCDIWRWRTDTEHCLISLSPPGGSTASQWLYRDQPLPESLPRVPWWSCFEPEDAPRIRQCMEAHAPLQSLEVHRPRTSEGSNISILRGSPWLDEHGNFGGYCGTVKDSQLAITATETATTPKVLTIVPARGPAAPALAKSEAEAFHYTVSHDLRAPLRVVEGFSRILKEDYGRALDRIGNDHIDRILGAAQRMHHMIDALLALSKLSNHALKREKVDLSGIATNICEELCRHDLGRNVDIQIEPGLNTQGDPTLLRVLLENLLGNAWKYSSKCPQARIALTRHPSQAHGFTVSDNGAGFDMRFADRLFNPFQRLHSASDFQGHGVGLASVKRIVARHGGEIWAESEVGRGARFHFTLPVTHGSQMQDTPAPPRQASGT